MALCQGLWQSLVLENPTTTAYVTPECRGITKPPKPPKHDRNLGLQVSRPVAEDGRLAARLKASLADCARPATDPLQTCDQMQLYQDVTGNVGAPQASNVQ